jgi:hypothetical protein
MHACTHESSTYLIEASTCLELEFPKAPLSTEVQIGVDLRFAACLVVSGMRAVVTIGGMIRVMMHVLMVMVVWTSWYQQSVMWRWWK